MDDIVFKHELEVDVMWIDGDPALHIIDRGTRYSVAQFMVNQSAEHTWDILVEFWITVFTGYPTNNISRPRKKLHRGLLSAYLLTTWYHYQRNPGGIA